MQFYLVILDNQILLNSGLLCIKHVCNLMQLLKCWLSRYEMINFIVSSMLYTKKKYTRIASDLKEYSTWKNYNWFLFSQLETKIKIITNIFHHGNIQLHLHFPNALIRMIGRRKCIWRSPFFHTYHENHWSFWFKRATNTTYIFDLFVTNIRSLLQYVDGFSKENVLCLLDNCRYCSLKHHR